MLLKIGSMLRSLLFTVLVFAGNQLFAKDLRVNIPKTEEASGGRYPVAICAIFQNDAPFMKEWIEFHKIQSVAHFYLYDNNSTDEFEEVLSPYLKSGEVTLIHWPYSHEHADGSTWNDIQTNAYNHCLQFYGPQADWIAFIDTDEFLFCPSGRRLNKFLNSYREYGGVAANWLMFGTSYVHTLKGNELMIELLTRCAPHNYQTNVHVKSIVRPKHVTCFRNPHYAFYHPDKFAVESDFTRIDGPYSSTIKLDKIRINHYWVKTERYLHETKIPRRNHMYGEDPSVFLNLVEELNSQVDTAILQFVPELKKRMFPS